MDKYPIIWNGSAVGEMTTEVESLYTWIEAQCPVIDDGLWCAWVVGEQGELRLGVLEPLGEKAVIRRRYANRLVQPLGKLLRGEMRPVAEERPRWEAATEPERLFQTPWIRKELQGRKGVLWRREERGRELAVPYDKEKPFPLTAIFCFSRILKIGEQSYACFSFDEREWPKI